MIDRMIDRMIRDPLMEDLKRKGFALAAESLKILVGGGSMDGRRLPCR